MPVNSSKARLLTALFPVGALLLGVFLVLSLMLECEPGDITPPDTDLVFALTLGVVFNAWLLMTPAALRWRRVRRLPVGLISVLFVAFFLHGLVTLVFYDVFNPANDTGSFESRPWRLAFMTMGLGLHMTSCVALVLVAPLAEAGPVAKLLGSPERIAVAAAVLTIIAVGGWSLGVELPRLEWESSEAECQRARAAGGEAWERYVREVKRPKRVPGPCVGDALRTTRMGVQASER